jgi:hypothetical protein
MTAAVRISISCRIFALKHLETKYERPCPRRLHGGTAGSLYIDAQTA